MLVTNVRATTDRVLLPGGVGYCLEDAATEDAQDECAGDLEDALFNANRKLDRTRLTVERFVVGEKRRRQPCGWWRRVTGRCGG